MPYIIAASLLGGAVCSGITAAWYRRRLKRANKDAWRSAEIYYTRRAAERRGI